MERLDVSEGDLARFFPINKIREMIRQGNNNDIMTGYNANLFAYTMIQLPTDLRLAQCRNKSLTPSMTQLKITRNCYLSVDVNA